MDVESSYLKEETLKQLKKSAKKRGLKMKVQSSLLDEIFDWKEVNGQGQFDVRYPNGKYYRYFNVPKGIYDRMLTAPSIGKYFDQYIKKAEYKYEEVTNLYWKGVEEEPATYKPSPIDVRLKTAAQRIRTMIQKAVNERGAEHAFAFADEYFSVPMIAKAIEEELILKAIVEKIGSR